MECVLKCARQKFQRKIRKNGGKIEWDWEKYGKDRVKKGEIGRKTGKSQQKSSQRFEKSHLQENRFPIQKKHIEKNILKTINKFPKHN